MLSAGPRGCGVIAALCRHIRDRGEGLRVADADVYRVMDRHPHIARGCICKWVHDNVGRAELGDHEVGFWLDMGSRGGHPAVRRGNGGSVNPTPRRKIIFRWLKTMD